MKRNWLSIVAKRDCIVEQIEEWRTVCLQANGQVFDQPKQLKGSLKEEQKFYRLIVASILTISAANFILVKQS
ncbi:hypothetical protein [Bacillus sp. V3B]|uniref:hypothetical protein n=1 Tax=Bacillus sp. V3B TaxID=2804915 RepID=UPI00210E48E8|nr:hypothetical protein [Bacillus sp. V3B]